MVLIGARTDASGKRWFLLQNWWKEKQFVEVSEDYMGYCKPQTYFVYCTQSNCKSEMRSQLTTISLPRTNIWTSRSRFLGGIGSPTCPLKLISKGLRAGS